MSERTALPVLKRSAEEREWLAEFVEERLSPAMTVLGIVFALVVVGDTLIGDESPWSGIFDVAGWLIWAAFVGEFIVRLVIAPSTGQFLKTNWWQLIFLALPFLRFVRLIQLARLGRAGRVLSSAIRTGRSAGAKLRSRLGWLLSLTLIVILASSQLLYEFGGFPSFGEAIHDAALATITGEPFARDSGVADIIEIVLAAYSVVVFASLAGAIGAFFFEERRSGGAPLP